MRFLTQAMVDEWLGANGVGRRGERGFWFGEGANWLREQVPRTQNGMHGLLNGCFAAAGWQTVQRGWQHIYDECPDNFPGALFIWTGAMRDQLFAAPAWQMVLDVYRRLSPAAADSGVLEFSPSEADDAFLALFLAAVGQGTAYLLPVGGGFLFEIRHSAFLVLAHSTGGRQTFNKIGNDFQSAEVGTGYPIGP